MFLSKFNPHIPLKKTHNKQKKQKNPTKTKKQKTQNGMEKFECLEESLNVSTSSYWPWPYSLLSCTQGHCPSLVYGE